MKRREVKYKIPLYHGDLIIIQDKNLKWVQKKYDTISLEDIGACTFPYPKKSGATRYIMVFYGETSPKIIAHEALHVVNDIFKDRYIKLDISNDEPQAYLLGWIVEKCHKFLKIG